MACEKYKSYQKPENLKHKLHFTGSSTVSYDGSNDVTVNIPSSGDATNGSLLIKADNNDYVSFDGGENRSVNLRSGSNVRIDKATTGGQNLDLTINATDTTYDVATPSTNGLMSASDKVKLDSLIFAYPVGSVYISISSNFNPNTSFGGVWERFGQGRTLIGEGTGSDGSTSMSFTANSTGGKYAETLTTEQIPSHNHRVPFMRTSNEASNYGLTQAPQFGDRVIVIGDDTNDSRRTHSTYTGGGEPHNNVQPYITVYFWKRIA